MTKKAPKWYVVRKGKQTGIFNSRDDCKSSVHGFPGAQYKSYPSREEAELHFSHTYKESLSQSKQQQRPDIDELIKRGVVDHDSICVDAACSSNPGILEWRGVDTSSGQKLFQSTQYPLGTTNIGERLAIIEGMQYLIDNNRRSTNLYSDSRTAIGWIKKKTIRTTLPKTSTTKQLWSLIEKQLERLQSNTTTINVQKRETKERGEIPADFGRK